MANSMTFAPLLPWPFWIAIAVISALICLYMLVRMPLSGLCRTIAAGLLLLLLAGPKLVEETTSPLPDIALIIEDRSASQDIDGRAEATAAAADALRARLENIDELEVRTVSAEGREETRLDQALYDGLSDMPRNQLAGIFILSDGQSSMTPDDPAALGIAAPVHALLTGRAGERDRVLEVISAPRFGIINETAEISFVVNDYGAGERLVNVTLKANGEEVVNRADDNEYASFYSVTVCMKSQVNLIINISFNIF